MSKVHHSKAKICIISSTFILGICCAIAYSCYFYFSRTWSENYCNSPLCVRSAQNLIAAMNTSADPCHNFYNFACGNFARQYKPSKYWLQSDWFIVGTELILKNISTYLKMNGSDSDPKPVLQARILYKQCLGITADREDKTFDPISSVLKDIGLPVLPPLQGASSNFSLLYSMARSKLIYDGDFFVSFGISEDPENPRVLRLSLIKPSLDSPLPARFDHIFLHDLKKRPMEKGQVINDDDVYARVLEWYETFDYTHVNVNESSNSSDKSNLYAKEFDEYASKVFEFAYNGSKESWTNVSNATLHANIANLTKTNSCVRKLVNSHFSKDSAVPPMRMSVKSLQKMTDDLWPNDSAIPKIIWEDYFKQMFKDVPDIKLNFEGKRDAEIVIHDLHYILTILKWISGMTTLQELEMYMWWTTVSTIAPYISGRIPGCASKKIEPGFRNVRCASLVNSVYGMAMTYSLVNDLDKQNDMDEITKMTKNIQSTFKESLKNIAWMDNETKKVAAEKLEKMKSCVGFPTWLNDPTNLGMYYHAYEKIRLDENTFLKNILLFKQTMLSLLQRIYGNEIMTSEKIICHFQNPMTVNAFHMREGNQIIIPVGILQFPFYEQGLQVLNYGSIGSIIGHELTHGFDNGGKEYDFKGRTGHSGWTNETMIKFQKRVQCFIDHYETFHENSSSSKKTSSEPTKSFCQLSYDEQSRGSRTLDENIADNGGLRHAFYAYRNYVLQHGSERSLPELKDYTSEQLFFLAYANVWCEADNERESYLKSTDEHSPKRVRVWGTLTNSKEFAEAWKCKLGTPMNPAESKCEMW